MVDEINNESIVKILVVDDEPLVLDFISQVLKKAGYLIMRAGDGVQALEALKAELPDVIISDLLMPNMDGIELCKAIRAQERTKAIPFIIVSGMEDEQSVLLGLHSGVDVYLLKPINSRLLLARVRSLTQPHNERLKDEG
jgi:DNA-binding response OmpR family regulator